jgi:hypothetical protein
MGLRRTIYALACPGCGQDESLVIKMWGWHHLSNDDPDDDDNETGIDEADSNDGPHNFDPQSEAGCWKCDWEGTVADCKAAGAK